MHSNLSTKGKNYKRHKFRTKSLRMNDMIYLDLECLLRKYDTCSNDPNKSSTEKIAYHEACGYSICTIRNHTKESICIYHRGKDSLSKLCKELRDQAIKLINTKNLPLTTLTPNEQAIHDKSNKCHICNRKFITDENRKYYKKLLKDIDHDHYPGKYRGTTHSICNLRYQTPKDIPVVIHNGSNCDFHLLITELAKEFRSDMKYIGEKTEKYISFLIPIKKNREDGKFTTYRLKFIDNARFMSGSLSNHVNNLSELYNCNCEYKKDQRISIKCKKEMIHTRCKTCHKRSKQTIQLLKDKFPNTYQLCNNNINKFLLLLRKGVYPYEYMDTWEKFDETKLPKNNDFYSELNLEHITKEDYKHAKSVWNACNTKNLGEYHDLYVQSDTLQLADA